MTANPNHRKLASEIAKKAWIMKIVKKKTEMDTEEQIAVTRTGTDTEMKIVGTGMQLDDQVKTTRINRDETETTITEKDMIAKKETMNGGTEEGTRNAVTGRKIDPMTIRRGTATKTAMITTIGTKMKMHMETTTAAKSALRTIMLKSNASESDHAYCRCGAHGVLVRSRAVVEPRYAHGNSFKHLHVEKALHSALHCH